MTACTASPRRAPLAARHGQFTHAPASFPFPSPSLSFITVQWVSGDAQMAVSFATCHDSKAAPPAAYTPPHPRLIREQLAAAECKREWRAFCKLLPPGGEAEVMMSVDSSPPQSIRSRHRPLEQFGVLRRVHLAARTHKISDARAATAHAATTVGCV